MSKNTNLSFLTDFLTADIVNSRVGMNNVSPQSTFDVTGTGKFSGVLTLGSTVSNGTYTYTLPSATGTLALTSDIPSVSGYVPYTGANQSVDLGYNSLAASFLRVNGTGPTLGSYLGFKHSTNVTTGADGYTSIYTFGTNTIAFKSISGATTRDFSFSMASITPGVAGGRTYTLPDADGTIALTSSLSGYLPLTGGTLTGALNGTSATFSSTVGIGTATSPAADLQVGKSSDVTIAMSNSSSVTTGNRGSLAWYNSSTSTVANIRAVAVTDNVGTELQFYTRPVAGSLTQVLTLASTGVATFSTTENQGGVYVTSATDNTTLRISSTAANGQEWRLQSTGGTSGLGAGKLIFKVGGTETASNIPLTLTTDNSTNGGRVGIGTTSPVAALNVSNVPTSFYGIIETTGTSAGAVKHFRVHKPGYVEYGIGILADNSFHISTASTFPTTNGFTFTSIGNVGIGTTPVGRLSVAQTLGDGGMTGGITIINDSGVMKGSLFAGGGPPRNFGHLFLRDDTNIDVVVFRAGGTNYILNQNFGIGTNLPTEKLHIYGVGAGPELRMEGISHSWYIRAYNDNFNILTPTGRIVTSYLNNGDVRNYNNTTTWQQVSDARVKENINTIPDAISKILALNPVIFDYKKEFADKNNWDDNKKINNTGFIAQEFEAIFPKYISTNECVIGETVVDDFKSIDTGHLVAYLVKAIQEQQQQIQELKNKLS